MGLWGLGLAAEGRVPELDCRLLLDALPDAVLAVGGDGRIIYANRAVADLLQWDLGTLLGLPIGRVLRDRPRRDQPVESTAAAAMPGSVGVGRVELLQAVRGDGAVTHVEVKVARIDPADPGGDGTLIATIRAPGGRGGRELERERSLTRLLRATTKGSARLAETPVTDDLADEIARAFVADFEATRASVWLAEPSDRGLGVSLVRRGIAGENPGEIPDFDTIDPATDGSAVGGAARSRRPAVRASDLGFVAAFPMLSVGELRGVLEVEMVGVPDSEVIDAAATSAALAASGLNDARVLLLEQEARTEAEAQSNRLRSILDAISVGVILAEGTDGRISLDNRSARQILGDVVQADSLRGFLESFPMEELDGRRTAEADRPFWRTFHRGERTQRTLKYRRPDGRPVILDIQTAPFPGPQGGAISTFADVTDRHRLESELAERAGQLRALLDHLPVGVAYFDPSGICRASNGLARKVLGWSGLEIVGTSAEALLAGEPELRDALMRAVRGPESHGSENVPWAGDNSRFLDWRFEPLPTPDPAQPRGAMALIVDVTERAEAEFALQRTARSAQQASARKTQFLSAVSHDLRTPVNALSLQVELLTRMLELREDPDPVLAQLADEIGQVAANLVELINDLLDLTRFDSGAVDYKPVEFPIDEMLRQTFAPMEATADEKALVFHWRAEPGRGRLRGDRVQLARVLTNLVGNALKFTERGRVDVLIRAADGGGLSLSVRDTGVGIPKEGLEQVFDEFAQLRNPERDRTKGTGLGLAICRRLLDQVGGWITVESELGVGSVFSAHYPPGRMDLVAEPEPGSRIDHDPEPSDHPTAPRAQPPDADAPPTSPVGSILVVEDDSNSRRTLSRLLAHAGHSVSEAPGRPIRAGPTGGGRPKALPGAPGPDDARNRRPRGPQGDPGATGLVRPEGRAPDRRHPLGPERRAGRPERRRVPHQADRPRPPPGTRRPPDPRPRRGLKRCLSTSSGAGNGDRFRSLRGAYPHFQ